MNKCFLPLLISLALVPAHAEDLRIDPGIWFASPAREAADRASLITDASALPVLEQPSPAELLDYLHKVEGLTARNQRHAAYLHLASARDIDDHATDQARSAVAAAGDIVSERTRKTLRNVGAADFAKDAAARPDLAKYHWLLERATRALPHELPEAEQSIVSVLSDQDSESFWAIYQKTRRATHYGLVHTASGDLDVNKDAETLAKDLDRHVREQAWKQRQDALASQAETYAAVLIGIVRLNDRIAKLEHFKDAPESVYFSRLLDRADVDATSATVQAQASVLQDYQRLRANHAARRLGLDQTHRWDLSVPLPGFTTPTFDEAQLRTVIPAALAPLGADYTAHFRALLDPATKRTDLATTEGSREDDSFSLAAPGAPSTLFLSVWKPTVQSGSVVAHEGGHAIQSQLMDEHGVSPFFARGPNWMQEGVAILNEMLFYEYLYQHTNDPAQKAYYLQAQLDEMSFQIFTSAEEAQLEEGIYDGVIAGKIKDAADIDALTLEITKRFEIWPSIDPELSHAWIGKRLMFEDPLYLANYLYAGLWATKMFAMATTDPADFQKRYSALMAEGFDAPPDVLLAHFFGRKLTPAELVGADMQVISGKVAELDKLYRGLDRAGVPSHK